MALVSRKYQNVLHLSYCALGICFCYWFYGFLQENLLTHSGLGATFVLVFQTLSNVFVAFVWRRVESGDDLSQKSKQHSCLKNLNHPLLGLVSSTYVFAMVASNESLQFVSYPTAVLAKSCKMIPTMVCGTG
jgi:UDP-galactose transporter B1